MNVRRELEGCWRRDTKKGQITLILNRYMGLKEEFDF
jgi:hypothetical protein